MRSWPAFPMILAGLLASGPSRAAGVDINDYCQWLYGTASTAVLGDRGNPFSWRCTFRDRQVGIDLDQACRRQYGPDHTVVLLDRSDALSWQCIATR